MSFPPGTEMFQFPGFASPSYVFRRRSPLRVGFPHSEISGSKFARNSPKLIAACHVLHRLSVPRHPPNALIILDRKSRHAQRTRRTNRKSTVANNSSLARHCREDTVLPNGQHHRQNRPVLPKVRILPLHDVQEIALFEIPIVRATPSRRMGRSASFRSSVRDRRKQLGHILAISSWWRRTESNR